MYCGMLLNGKECIFAVPSDLVVDYLTLKPIRYKLNIKVSNLCVNIGYGTPETYISFWGSLLKILAYNKLFLCNSFCLAGLHIQVHSSIFEHFPYFKRIISSLITSSQQSLGHKHVGNNLAIIKSQRFFFLFLPDAKLIEHSPLGTCCSLEPRIHHPRPLKITKTWYNTWLSMYLEQQSNLKF